MGHVFISYSRKDISYAMRLAGSLEALGIPHWIDEERLEGSQDWSTDLQEAVEKAKVLAVVMSPNSESSEWVMKEVKIALDNGIIISPLLLRGHGFSNLRDIQYYSVLDRKLPSVSYYQLMTDLLEPFMQKPIFQAITSKQRQGDLVLLAKLWGVLNSTNLRDLQVAMNGGSFPERRVTPINQYFELRDLPENRFISQNVEQAVQTFDERLWELREAMTLAYQLEGYDEQARYIPIYKLSKTDEGYHYNAQKHEEVLEQMKIVWSEWHKLLQIIKQNYPDFAFNS